GGVKAIVPSPICVFSSPCRMGVRLCAEHFVERLAAIAHFSVPALLSPLSTLFRQSYFERNAARNWEAKVTEQTNFGQNHPPLFAPFHALIREHARRSH